jgi:hypothetical protein
MRNRMSGGVRGGGGDPAAYSMAAARYSVSGIAIGGIAALM